VLVSLETKIEDKRAFQRRQCCARRCKRKAGGLSVVTEPFVIQTYVAELSVAR
jgi:hypothetical protein